MLNKKKLNGAMLQQEAFLVQVKKDIEAIKDHEQPALRYFLDEEGNLRHVRTASFHDKMKDMMTGKTIDMVQRKGWTEVGGEQLLKIVEKKQAAARAALADGDKADGAKSGGGKAAPGK